jgi:tetratricopeptide (TPR) repeat protein
MPTPITAYRVFIASPGGLKDERDTFRLEVNGYNEADAIERSVIFLPIGWEITLGGAGRPQHLINEDLRRCDYFVLMLWDHWGSRTAADGAGPYTSGSEEEFEVARECLRNGTMREMLILFKDVDEAKLRDPGKQLERVLAFKKTVEDEKEFLFETFDGCDALATRLRKHLAKWTRAHEQGAAGAPAKPPAPVVALHAVQAPEVAPEAASPAVRDAERLAGEGRLTEAEAAYASAIADKKLASLDSYGTFLFNKESYEKAEVLFMRLHDSARKQGSFEWTVASLTNLARLYEHLRRYESAEKAYLELLELRETRLGPKHPEVADTLNLLGELYITPGVDRLDDAEPLFRRALEIEGVALAG